MQRIIVVDNFYKDPVLVRKMALASQFEDVRGLNYPGFQSLKSFASPSLVQSFSKITSENLVVSPENLTFGKFRVMLDSTGSRLKIHVDGDTDWTGLVYLNLPEQCQGGTAFYKHIRTGLSEVPSPEQISSAGFATWREMEKSVVGADSLDLHAWELMDYVGMKFNRLVLFRGDKLFHAHTCAFGDSLVNGRLTQNFFFRTAA